jgi:hypothetical protein
MPVLGGDLEGKGEPEEVVDDGRDGPAVLDGKRAVLEPVRGRLQQRDQLGLPQHNPPEDKSLLESRQR